MRLPLTAAVRTTVLVCIVLVTALAGTGFVTAAYVRERVRLGNRHYAAGQRLASAGDLTGAAEEYRKALLFSPDRQQYRLALATALVMENKLDEAQAHLEQLSQEDPTDGKINFLLARVALRQNKVEKAIEAYQRAVYEYWPADEFSERREARWELIDLLQETGKNRDQLVGELLQLYGNLPQASNQRMRVGTLLLNDGADNEAARVFHDVLRLPSAGADTQQEALAAYLGLATIGFRAGDFIEARHEYQKALRLSPKDAEAASALRTTNDVIDMAPELPNISASERVRRSQNLLNRVESDLTKCFSDTGQQELLAKRFSDVKTALAAKLTDQDDAASRLQQLALDLWKDRATFCGQTLPRDTALETVLSRLGQQG